MIEEYVDEPDTLEAAFKHCLVGLIVFLVGSAVIYVCLTTSVLGFTTTEAIHVDELSEEEVSSNNSSIVMYEELSQSDKEGFREAVAEDSGYSEQVTTLSDSWSGEQFVKLDGEVYEVTHLDYPLMGYTLIVTILGIITVLATLFAGLVLLVQTHGFFAYVLDNQSGILFAVLIALLVSVAVFGPSGVLGAAGSTPLFEKSTFIGETADNVPEGSNIVLVSEMESEQKDNFYVSLEEDSPYGGVEYDSETYLKSDGEYYALEKDFSLKTIAVDSLSVLFVALFFIALFGGSGFLMVSGFELWQKEKGG